MNAQHRTFDTGATRNLDQHKLDYEAFLCPLVLERYAQYMHANRMLPDGTLRAGDNWQRGIPSASYMKSTLRHAIETWKAHRGYPAEDIQTSLCALIFNASGYLHELLMRQSVCSPTLEDTVPYFGGTADPGHIMPDATVDSLLPPGSQAGED